LLIKDDIEAASGGNEAYYNTLRKPTTPACAGAGCANKDSALIKDWSLKKEKEA